MLIYLVDRELKHDVVVLVKVVFQTIAADNVVPDFISGILDDMPVAVRADRTTLSQRSRSSA